MILIALATLSLNSCAERCPSGSCQEETPEIPALSHTVKYQGETLTLISLWYTGSTENWRMIEAANPDLNPLQLRTGDVVSVPPDLLVRTEEMPKKFVQRALSLQERRSGNNQKAGTESNSARAMPRAESMESTPASPPPSPAEASAAEQQQDKIIRALLGE